MTDTGHPVERCTSTVIGRWRDEASVLRRRGQTKAAESVESMAAELEEWVGDWLDAAVTLRKAAEMGGYAYSTLEHRVRVGSLPNAGQAGRPRLRRRDVPLKVRHYSPRAAEDPNDLDQLLREIGS